MRLYSRCVKVGRVEVDLSGGYSHTVSTMGVPSRRRQMRMNANGQVWSHLETSHGHHEHQGLRTSVKYGVLDTTSNTRKWVRQSGHKKPTGVVTIGRDNTVVDPLGTTERLWTRQARIESTCIGRALWRMNA